jgi:hypothetical protein
MYTRVSKTVKGVNVNVYRVSGFSGVNDTAFTVVTVKNLC